MTTFADFLAARLTDDWRKAEGLMTACRDPRIKPDFGGCGGPAAEEFFAHFDPARMLREVEAGRKLLARWREADTRRSVSAEDEARAWLLDGLLADRAAVWSDHPDYDPGWKP